MASVKRTKMALPLPARVVRQLLRGPWGRSARDVLDVGCENGRLVAWLQRRGKSAGGIDDRTAAEPLLSGVADLHQRSLSAGFPFAPHRFDLILVRGTRAYAGDLSAPETLIGTANLLSSLRPGCRAVFLDPTDLGRGCDPARVAALENFLAQFPGHIDTAPYEDGLGRFLSLEWLLGRNRDIPLTLITLTVPRKPISRLVWHQQARQLVMRAMAARAA